jgi:hypothetical protein
MDEAGRNGLDAKHFAEEHRALQLYLEENWFPSATHNWPQQFEMHSSELARVNQALWDLENEIRHLKSLSSEERREKAERIVSIALAIPELNDDRAGFVGMINALFGLTAQEKLYRTPAQGNKEGRQI